jgi:hypothetical protein
MSLRNVRGFSGEPQAACHRGMAANALIFFVRRVVGESASAAAAAENLGGAVYNFIVDCIQNARTVTRALGNATPALSARQMQAPSTG